MKVFTVKLLLGCMIALSCVTAGTVTVQPIQICDNNDQNCANPSAALDASETNKIWAQAGITLSFNSFWYADQTDYLNLFIDQEPTTDTFLQNLVLPEYNPHSIYMFFIHSLTDVSGGGVFYGLTNSLGGNIIFITDEIFAPAYGGNGRIDTIAHELGHAFGLEHSDDLAGTCTGYENRLMASGSCRSVPADIDGITSNGITGLDLLSAQEIAAAQSSQYNTPEPGTVLLAASSFGLIWIIRRRRSAPVC